MGLWFVRIRWKTVVAFTAALALLVVGSLIWLHGEPGFLGTAPIPSTSTSASPGTPVESSPVPAASGPPSYRALAVAASKTTLAAFQSPPMATQLRGRPRGWVDSQPSDLAHDPTLTRESWWRTSLSVDRVASYLASHPPEGMVVVRIKAHGSVPTGFQVLSQQYRAVGNPHPDAYSSPHLYVFFESLRGQTFLKVATSLDVRYVAPAQARIDEPIASVLVERSHARSRDGKVVTRRLASLTASQDSRLISRLVDSYNHLRGSYTVVPLAVCGIFTPSGSTSVTFTGESGRVWRANLRTGCLGQVEVATDGQELAVTLDPAGWLRTVNDVSIKSAGS